MEPCKIHKSAAYAPVDVHVGKRIKERRKALDLTLAALGELVGLSFQQIQHYENGTTRIGASRLFELGEVLDVPVSYFFDDMPSELAGPPPSENQNMDIFDTSEAAEVTRIYLRIKDPSMRLHFRELAKNTARSQT
jgi:transcriptional regulator with XRE-family HTH domain